MGNSPGQSRQFRTVVTKAARLHAGVSGEARGRPLELSLGGSQYPVSECSRTRVKIPRLEAARSPYDLGRAFSSAPNRGPGTHQGLDYTETVRNNSAVREHPQPCREAREPAPTGYLV